MLILTEADVRSLITLAEAVPAIRQAVAEEAGGRHLRRSGICP